MKTNIPTAQKDGMLHAGIVGCGHIARAHIQACGQAKLPIVFDAFCDFDKSKASRFVTEFEGRYSTTDLKRLAEDQELNNSRKLYGYRPENGCFCLFLRHEPAIFFFTGLKEKREGKD